jgi:hypothetical protein
MKYVAEIEHVAETSLLGVADAAVWQRQAAAAGLALAERDGRAQLMLSACAGRFRGVTFRELSISVAVEGLAAGEPTAWLMVHAFNSLRLFAWVERTMFATPYYRGRIDVSASVPGSMAVDDGAGRLRAAMGFGQAAGGQREPVRRGEEGFEGWIYLPPRGRVVPGGGKRSYARIRGATEAYAFEADRDVFETAASDRTPAFAWLAESQFTGVEWQLRGDASHAKSKTVRWSSESQAR